MALRRIFVAVTPPEEERHRLAALLQDVTLPGQVVSPTKWHVTLRFVGDVDDVTLDRIQAALDEAELGDPFAIRWGGLGAFPRSARATVLWLGLDGGIEPLHSLADGVETALDRAGIASEDRPFRPHLTLSRIRPQQDVTELVESVAPPGGGMKVATLDLYQSHLARGGARYEVIESFPLG